MSMSHKIKEAHKTKENRDTEKAKKAEKDKKQNEQNIPILIESSSIKERLPKVNSKTSLDPKEIARSYFKPRLKNPFYAWVLDLLDLFKYFIKAIF